MTDLTVREAYEEWADDLVRFATVLLGPAEAADVVADSFAGLLEDPVAWHRVERPRPFLFGVVANRARMLVRSSSRRRDREDRYELERVEPTPVTGEESMDARELLGSVSVQQRTFLYLAYWEDWSVAEIAGHVGVGEGTVRKQLARARSTLREVLV